MRYQPTDEERELAHLRRNAKLRAMAWKANPQATPSLYQLRERLQGLKEHTHRAYNAEHQYLWVQGQHANPIGPPPVIAVTELPPAIEPTPVEEVSPAYHRKKIAAAQAQQFPRPIDEARQRAWKEHQRQLAIDEEASRLREREFRQKERWQWTRLSYAVFKPGTIVPVQGSPGLHFTTDRSGEERVLVTRPLENGIIYIFFASHPDGPIGRYDEWGKRLMVLGPSPHEGNVQSGRTRKYEPC